MNDPLKRKMFRQVGMSKQPMGILASSPELMTTAQKAMMSGQPVMAQSGKFISTAPTVGFGTNNQPSSGNFIKSALTSNNPSALGQVINYGLKGLSAKKDSDADSATAEANKKSRNKTVGPYSQTDMTKATGSEIGMASAGDVDEKDGLIFDGDKFNFYEDQKNAPTKVDDRLTELRLLKDSAVSKTKDFKEAYTNAPSNLLNTVKKYVSNSSIAKGETGIKIQM